MRLLLFFMLYPGPSPVGGMMRKLWTCSLNAIPAENVTVPSVQHRYLLRGPEMDAILLPRGNIIERRTHSGNESTVFFRARPCKCANRHPKIVDEFYCPEPSNYCTISKSVYGDEYSVTCAKYKGWKILFLRSNWFYIFWTIMLYLGVLIFSTPGHVSIRYSFCPLTFKKIHSPLFTSILTQHAIRYPISRCFPKINLWITDHLLQAEILSRNRVRDEYEHAAHLTRRTEGWISGYSIKTKLYSSRDAATEKDVECNANAATEDQTAIRVTPQCERYGYDAMCTICLLELEDGDRVADLSCGHMYHADCLGEWILKKVCPVFVLYLIAMRPFFLCTLQYCINSLFVLRTHAHYARIKTSPKKSDPLRQMMLEIATYLTPKAGQPDGSVLVIFAWTLQREEVDGANERSVTHQGLSRNEIEFYS